MISVWKIEELGEQGMVDEAQSLMAQVEELEKEKNSYSSRSGSRVQKYYKLVDITVFYWLEPQLLLLAQCSVMDILDHHLGFVYTKEGLVNSIIISC